MGGSEKLGLSLKLMMTNFMENPHRFYRWWLEIPLFMDPPPFFSIAFWSRGPSYRETVNLMNVGFLWAKKKGGNTRPFETSNLGDGKEIHLELDTQPYLWIPMGAISQIMRSVPELYPLNKQWWKWASRPVASWFREEKMPRFFVSGVQLVRRWNCSSPAACRLCGARAIWPECWDIFSSLQLPYTFNSIGYN